MRWHVDRSSLPPRTPYFPAEFASAAQKKKKGRIFFFSIESVFPLFRFNFEIPVTNVGIPVFLDIITKSKREVFLMEKRKETFVTKRSKKLFCDPLPPLGKWKRSRRRRIRERRIISYRASVIFQKRVKRLLYIVSLVRLNNIDRFSINYNVNNFNVSKSCCHWY